MMQKWWTQQRSCEVVNKSISQTKSICRSSASATTIYVIRQDYECSICKREKRDFDAQTTSLSRPLKIFPGRTCCLRTAGRPTLGTPYWASSELPCMQSNPFPCRTCVFSPVAGTKGPGESPRFGESSVTSTSRAEAMRSITPKTEMFAVGDIRQIKLGNLNWIPQVWS